VREDLEPERLVTRQRRLAIRRLRCRGVRMPAQKFCEAGSRFNSRRHRIRHTPDGETPKGAHAIATGYQDRALMSAVAIVPVQLLAWKLAAAAGRTPGVYTRASKVTTRE